MLVAASSTTFLGLSTLSLSALIVYGSIGVAYMFSGARECYNSEHSPLDLLKSRITGNGFVNTLGAVLWSPFLLVGGVAGATAKAVVNVFSSKSSNPGNGSSPMTDSSDDEEASKEDSAAHHSHSHSRSHSLVASQHDERISQEPTERTLSVTGKDGAEEQFESALSSSGSQTDEVVTALHSSTESITHSGDKIATSFRLPISKSQEGLSSYNKMTSGLDAKPSPARDDTHQDQAPVNGTRLLRRSAQVVSTQNDEQHQTPSLQ
jgi:hypothetical protein